MHISLLVFAGDNTECGQYITKWGQIHFEFAYKCFCCTAFNLTGKKRSNFLYRLLFIIKTKCFHECYESTKKSSNRLISVFFFKLHFFLHVFKCQHYFSIWILIYQIWETSRNKLKNHSVTKNCSEIRGWKPRICKIFEITRTIYSTSERSEQFLVTECFFNLFLNVSQIQ